MRKDEIIEAIASCRPQDLPGTEAVQNVAPTHRRAIALAMRRLVELWAQLNKDGEIK